MVCYDSIECDDFDRAAHNVRVSILNLRPDGDLGTCNERRCEHCRGADILLLQFIATSIQRISRLTVEDDGYKGELARYNELRQRLFSLSALLGADFARDSQNQASKEAGSRS